MTEFLESLRLLIQDHRSLEYSIIFLGTVFGGELALFSLGFLVAQGVVSTLPAVIVGFIGSFFPNILWFWLGKTNMAEKIVTHRYAHTTASSITEAVQLASKNNHLMAIIIAKFMVGTPVILTLYVSKTKLRFKEFMGYQSIALLLSLLFLIPIGFLSGLGFTYFSRILENIYASIGFFLLIIIVIIMIQTWIKKKFAKSFLVNEDKTVL